MSQPSHPSLSLSPEQANADTFITGNKDYRQGKGNQIPAVTSPLSALVRDVMLEQPFGLGSKHIPSQVLSAANTCELLSLHTDNTSQHTRCQTNELKTLIPEAFVENNEVTLNFTGQQKRSTPLIMGSQLISDGVQPPARALQIDTPEVPVNSLPGGKQPPILGDDGHLANYPPGSHEAITSCVGNIKHDATGRHTCRAATDTSKCCDADLSTWVQSGCKSGSPSPFLEAGPNALRHSGRSAAGLGAMVHREGSNFIADTVPTMPLVQTMQAPIDPQPHDFGSAGQCPFKQMILSQLGEDSDSDSELCYLKNDGGCTGVLNYLTRIVTDTIAYQATDKCTDKGGESSTVHVVRQSDAMVSKNPIAPNGQGK